MLEFNENENLKSNLETDVESMQVWCNQYERIQEMVSIGFWEYKIEQQQFISSQLTNTFFGFPPTEQITIDRLLLYVHQEDRKIAYLFLSNTTRQDIPTEIDIRLRKLNGQEQYIYLKRSITFDENNSPSILGIVQDITEQKLLKIEWNLTRLKLEESEQRYKSLQYYNPDGICTFDLTGLIIDVNPAFEQMLGYSAEELCQLTLLDILYTPQENEGDIKRGAFRGELKQDLEGTFQHKNGQAIEMNYRLVPIYVHSKMIGIYAIFRDISEQKQTEELLRKSDKLSVVGQLAAGLAHEIRNPLTSLKGFIQLLQTTNYNEKQMGYLNIMQDELQRIEMICSELLVLAKPQATDFRPEPIQFILRSVINLLESQALLYNVQFQLDIGENLPLVYCNENQMKQVFVNLIKNAIEAMQEGGLLNITTRLQADGQVLIQVIDQGKGIPESILSRIGEPFYTTKEKGTGLGIMVTKKIIEDHNGVLNFESKCGAGTTVSIILPPAGEF